MGKFSILFKISTINLTILISLNSLPYVKAQEVNISTLLNKDTILIGDQVTFDLSFSAPGNTNIYWPVFQDSLTSEIEITNTYPVGSSINKEKNTINLRQQLVITSFDSGVHKIPPVDIKYQLEKDTTTYQISSDPNYLHVHTIPVDTTKAIKPIKGPVKAPYTFREFLPWFLTIIAVILIVLILLYYFRWRKTGKKIMLIRPRPKLPAHITALNELEKLRNKRLWQSGKVKEYYTELTDIVRIYIKERFGIDAMEMTSFEIIDRLQKKDEISNELITKLRQTFDLSDLVKFAKATPLPSDNDRSHKYAEDFVKSTIPKPKTEEEENDENVRLKEAKYNNSDKLKLNQKDNKENN